MILYHGSNVVVNEPKLIESLRGKDFGVAFYLTPIKEQAERMARRKSIIMKNDKKIVSVFEWNEDVTNLIYKRFPDADKEWLDLILKCRSDAKYKHNYDIVEGKIADDKVGETILLVMDGTFTKEMALEKLRYQDIHYQYAFCSDASLIGLKFLYSYEVI